MTSKFYLMRHGLTNDDLPSNDRVSGWLPIPLNDRGRRDALRAARRLKQLDISSITSSDTKRASQTAKIVGEQLGIPVVESDRLRSWNMGSMEGMLHEAAVPFLEWFQMNPELKTPKGEPFQKFYNRFKGVWTTTIAYCRKFPNARPLLVTHSQDLDLVSWFLDGTKPGETVEFGEDIEAGGILEITVGDTISMKKLRIL